MNYLSLSARLAMAENDPDSQEAKLRHVRRRLNFGDDNDDNLPTKEELQRKFDEERRKELEEKKKKWNFDFSQERPVEGIWEWSPVKSQPGENKTPEGMKTEEKSAETAAEEQAL